MAKLVCDALGEPRILSASNNVNIIANALKVTPGVGQPFLYFASLPPGQLASVDYNLHQDWAGYGNLVRGNAAENLAMLNAMLSAPPTDAVVIV